MFPPKIKTLIEDKKVEVNNCLYYLTIEKVGKAYKVFLVSANCMYKKETHFHSSETLLTSLPKWIEEMHLARNTDDYLISQIEKWDGIMTVEV